MDIKEVLVSDFVDRASLLGKKISLGRKAQGYSQEVLRNSSLKVLGG